MNLTKMNYCEISKNANLPKRITILQFMCGISYLYIYYIVYKRIITSLKKKDEDQVDEEEKEETLTLIRPVDEEETLQIYEFEGTGEQLRRLRAYNPKNDGETHDEYESRIWNMAYKEDAEEERQKLLSKAERENAPVANFRDALKGLKQEWHAKWQRDQAVKGKI